MRILTPDKMLEEIREDINSRWKFDDWEFSRIMNKRIKMGDNKMFRIIFHKEHPSYFDYKEFNKDITDLYKFIYD